MPSSLQRPDERPAATRLGQLQVRIEALIERLRPWRWLWPPVAFGAGLGSFFLVERQQWLGGLLALGMLASWLLLFESLAARLSLPPLMKQPGARRANCA